MNIKILIFFLFFSLKTYCQNKDKEDYLTLIFTGDLMGHDSQISSAYDSGKKKYNYNNVFNKISPILKKADFTISNLELTFAGKPYSGYPIFCSPNELAIDSKKNGINVFVTANNHSYDKREIGMIKTLKTLDSFKILHTGTFYDINDRIKKNPLILYENNIKIALLNYTGFSNIMPIRGKAYLNFIDTNLILFDIQKSKSLNIDKIIVFLHWGNEYKNYPSKVQIKLTNFLFKNGVDIIVGAHPHVIQQMEFYKKTPTRNEHLVAYSLGNFVSGQTNPGTDGGVLLKVILRKKNGQTSIIDSKYILTWVNKKRVKGRIQYQILPCSQYEANSFKNLDKNSKEKMKLYINNSRKLLNKENKQVGELKVDK